MKKAEGLSDHDLQVGAHSGKSKHQRIQTRNVLKRLSKQVPIFDPLHPNLRIMCSSGMRWTTDTGAVDGSH